MTRCALLRGRSVPARWIFFALVAVAFALGSLAVAAEPFSYDDVRERTVRVSCAFDNGMGPQQAGSATGFVISPLGYVLTVRHIVPDDWRHLLDDPASWYRFTFEGEVAGEARPLEIVQSFPGGAEDALLLRVGDPKPHEVFAAFALTEVNPLKVRSQPVVWGFPARSLMQRPTSLGEPCSPGARCVLNLSLQDGFSGSPVLMSDRVVGWVTQTSTTALDESSFHHVHRLRDWLSGFVAPTVEVPRPLEPADGSQLTGFPRRVELRWEPARDARSYRVEIEARDMDGTWFPHPFGYGSQVVDRPAFDFEFVGSQPGRWRVAAISVAGEQGEFSSWFHFDYSQQALDPDEAPSRFAVEYFRDWSEDEPCDDRFIDLPYSILVFRESDLLETGACDVEIRALGIELRGDVELAAFRAAAPGHSASAPAGPAHSQASGVDRHKRGRDGVAGNPGRPGSKGNKGRNAGTLTLDVGHVLGDGRLTVDLSGQDGGLGQTGGIGGAGQRGAGGEKAEDGFLSCKRGPGVGGNGGPGGRGGSGGDGGDGGDGGFFYFSPAVLTAIDAGIIRVDVSGGEPGPVGPGGACGPPGAGGPRGSGSTFCGVEPAPWRHGQPGQGCLGTGEPGQPGEAGHRGDLGCLAGCVVTG